ncbi:MAG TPA: DUF4132 domain-containing protein [Candidatus Sulfopaludibacter sp.]|jgi:hypothetical protein|nr:DUF4132 domain-containing protein [Candidatus Sulfopaludibacter sp.]
MPEPTNDPAEAVRKLTPEQQVAYVLQALLGVSDRTKFSMPDVVEPLRALLRRKLPFTSEDILTMVRMGADPSYYFPFASVIRLAESIPMTAELAQALLRMRAARVLVNDQVEGHGDLKQRIAALLHPKAADAPFETAGAWSRQIAAELAGAWRGVLEAGCEISGREPSMKWRAAAADRVAEIGREPFRETALRWLALGPSPGDSLVQTTSRESDYQRGLLWALAEFADAEAAATVARFAEQCLRKIPALGAVSQRSGNASVGVLAAMGGESAVAQLARLALRIRYQTAQRLVREALEEAALRQGLTREELEEITVPSFGLDAGGSRVEVCGEYSLTLTAHGELTCRDAAGKGLKTIPEAVKRDFADDLKELKQAAKEIAPLRQAHRVRLERLLLTERAIPLETWRSAYLDHPLIGGMARQLIWQFSGGATAIWRAGAMVDWSGAEIEPSGPVRLWHPIRSNVQTVLSWRCRLEDDGVRQPFKQAHREVYLLTDAERATGTFSNRYAAHILRQHPFVALCGERGWHFRLMGQWDSHNNPYVEIPHAGLRAEYEVEFPRDEAANAHAIYIFLETRRLRFLKDGVACALESVAPAIFSEVMRDVDLFVSVTSIGNDPQWAARPNAPFLDYWNQVSFGELSDSGGQRKQILEGLLPKLSIRDRCRLEGRHLWVRGDRATYKIHLGSGSVLMEPGSRYLCIVRSTSTASDVYLPFDGDAMLSIILSKAFLLAADTKIKDASIARQLSQMLDS